MVNKFPLLKKNKNKQQQKKKQREKWWRTQVDWSFGLSKVSTPGLRGLLTKWVVQP